VAQKDEKATDLELIDAVAGGDWGAFDVLYHRYKDWTFRLAWRFAGNQTDAHDVVQEVFVYLAGKLRTGLVLKAGLTTLLYPAVKHTALAIKRKRSRQKEMIEGTDVPAGDPGPDPAALRAELSQVMASLSDAHREVLLMRFVDDMTLEEIGVALGVPVGTVKSRLHHAIAGLKEDGRLRRYFEK